MIIKSIKTSELYIVAFVLAIWGMDRLGIDVGQVIAVLLDLRTTAADVARELQGIEEPRGTAGYWLAAAWLAARTVLKVRDPGTGDGAGGVRRSRRVDPYRAWQQPADQQQERRAAESGVRQPERPPTGNPGLVP